MLTPTCKYCKGSLVKRDNGSNWCPNCAKTYCGQVTEVYSRVVGYFRPVSHWNKGKREEFKDRKVYRVSTAQVRAVCAEPVIAVTDRKN